jgi:hypothetical protein
MAVKYNGGIILGADGRSATVIPHISIEMPLNQIFF